MNKLATSILLALTVTVGCSDTTGVDRVQSLGVIEVAGFGPDISVPPAVEVPGTLEITFSTFGDSCVEAGDVDQEWGETTLTIRPMDWSYPAGTSIGEPCLDLIKSLSRRLQVSIPTSRRGSSLVVNLVGTSIPEGDTIAVSRVVEIR